MNDYPGRNLSIIATTYSLGHNFADLILNCTVPTQIYIFTYLYAALGWLGLGIKMTRPGRLLV